MLRQNQETSDVVYNLVVSELIRCPGHSSEQIWNIDVFDSLCVKEILSQLQSLDNISGGVHDWLLADKHGMAHSIRSCELHGHPGIDGGIIAPVVTDCLMIGPGAYH